MKIDESQLLDKIKKGDEGAFKEVYYSFCKAVSYFISHYISDNDVVKDLTQDTFIALWNNRDKMDSSMGYKSYLLTVARNKSLNYIRSQQYARGYSNSIEQRSRDIVNQSLNDNSLDRLLQKDVLSQINNYINNKLPDKYKEVFLLSRKKYFSNEKIAEELNISVKAVEYRIMVTLRLLRKCYGDYLLIFILNILGLSLFHVFS